MNILFSGRPETPVLRLIPETRAEHDQIRAILGTAAGMRVQHFHGWDCGDLAQDGGSGALNFKLVPSETTP